MTLSDRPVDHLADFARVHVLCLGDVMLDRFIYGEVRRVSPEAPIPVLQVRREANVLGGAGNVVRNIVALGGSASLIGVVGNDPNGILLLDLLRQEPAVRAEVLVVPERPTTTKTRFVAQGQQLLRADEEQVSALEPELARRVLDVFRAALAEADVVVLSDYAKGVLTDEVVRGAIAAARAVGKPVVVDPKGRDLSRYAGASVLTPNTSEVSVATGMPCTSDTEATAAGGTALAQAQADHLLLTRSEKGMMLLDRSGAPLFLRAQAREVFDVSGAGDTAVASLALALGAGVAMAGAAAIANAAAGIAVGKLGTAVVHASELTAALLSDDTAGGPSAKIMDLPAAGDRVAQWRAAGLRVGFTNGCFDLLHPGHVALLRQARAACDRLVVGLNTDASIKRIKSPERPIQPEEARAAVLASLADVDLVVLFDEDTPIRLIETLRPEVLLKGADYRLDQVVGADLVRGYGGEVVLVPLKEGHSTTNVVTRIRTARDGLMRLAE